MENSRETPFLASIKERRLLTKEGSTKKTFHIVLDLKGSSITYNAGDSIGVYPQNPLPMVLEILDILRFSENEMIVDKRTQVPLTIKDFLLKKGNIKDIPRKLYTKLYGERDDIKEYLKGRELIDILKGGFFTPQEFADSLLPQLPRFYSVASSQKVVPDEVHLTVGFVSYSLFGRCRFGTCSQYLCEIAPLGEAVVPIYVQGAQGFALPSNNEAPLIMIGPGTGVAPFRAFMQERRASFAQGKHWLIFGECHKATDFFYEEEWQLYEKEGTLKLTTAFSRDQEKKVYVQDRLLESSNEVYRWINAGAYVYLCGDAKRMAKDVEETLEKIFCTEGHMSEEEAKNALKHLRVVEKRYLKDVY